MITDILIEFALAIGRMFLNPLLYGSIIVAVILGYRRVKRERKFFHVRILWGWTELIGLLKEGLLLALIISILSIAIGLTVPEEFLFVLTVVSLISLIIYVFHILSPVILFALSVFVLWALDYLNWEINLLGIKVDGITLSEGTVVTATILAGLLVVAEGLLIRKKGAHIASPIVENSKRGLRGVAFTSKRAWILPIFLVIPGNAIAAHFPWWPQFSLGATQFSLILFPVVIGFQQLTRNKLPIHFYPKLGRSVLILGEIVIIGGLVAYFVPIVGFLTLMIGAVIRIAISYIYSTGQQKDVYAVSAKSGGVMIAGILPNSPAEKMGLEVGEIVRKVNGVEVQTERQLYEALQVNAAHCRLEVLNHKREVRLTQHVVHNNDHHQIGLLIAE